jgi:hypothetical protein
MYEFEYEFYVERVTASIDAQTLGAIRRIAGKRGVSAFLQAAARERLNRLRLLVLVDALDAAHGAPSDAIKAEVDADARRLFRSGESSHARSSAKRGAGVAARPRLRRAKRAKRRR